MSKNKVTPNNWPDEVRLKMIEKSEFYPGQETIYQYGYYDGYQKGIEYATQQVSIATAEKDAEIERLKRIENVLIEKLEAKRSFAQKQYNNTDLSYWENEEQTLYDVIQIIESAFSLPQSPKAE